MFAMITLTPTGNSMEDHWDTRPDDLRNLIAAYIGCTLVEPRDLDSDFGGLTAWFDEEGFGNQLPLNPYATAIAGLLGVRNVDPMTHHELGFVGTAVFTGDVDNDGEVTGLSPFWVTELKAAIADTRVAFDNLVRAEHSTPE